MTTNTGRAAEGSGWFLELEARMARGDFRDVTREDLPTPCLILDQAALERNLRRMADHSRATGLAIRPHVKVHRCVAIARRQLVLGAIGLSAATIAESELMSRAGLGNVLWTSQPAGRNKIARAVDLAQRDPTFLFVVDDVLVADLVEAAAAAAGSVCRVVVDVFAGVTRQGIQPGQTALALAQKVASARHLRLAGLMGYAGWASHKPSWEERRRTSVAGLAGLCETVDLCRRSGLPVELITGGSTGTYDIDTQTGLTELQGGSYALMDTQYRVIGSRGNPREFDDFEYALTVMATVTGRPHRNQCTIDAGDKAMLRPTDQVRGMPWVTIENQGAEYGILHWRQGEEGLQIGQRVELYPSTLDLATNACDRFYVADGERIVDAWPIMGRSGATQR